MREGMYFSISVESRLSERTFRTLVDVVAPGQSVVEYDSKMFVTLNLWYRNAIHRHGVLWGHTFDLPPQIIISVHFFSALNSIPQSQSRMKLQ